VSTPLGGPFTSSLFSWNSGAATPPSYTVTGTDGAGNNGTAGITFVGDGTAPSTSDNTGTIGTACKNTTQTVVLTPTDAGSGVANSFFTTNGTTPTTASSSGTSISLATDGTFTIKYFSTDNVGNSETVKTAGTAICIDKTAPTLTLSAANGGGTSKETFSGTASHGSGDLLPITLSVCKVNTFPCPGGQSGGASPYSATASATTGAYSTTTGNDFAAGTYFVQASQSDQAGNTGTSTVTSFTK